MLSKMVIRGGVSVFKVTPPSAVKIYHLMLDDATGEPLPELI